MIRFFLVLVLVVVGTIPLTARVQHLLPAPQCVRLEGQPFALGRKVRLVDGWSGCELLPEILQDELGCRLARSSRAVVRVTKVDRIEGADEPALAGFESEAYKLVVQGNVIEIQAESRLGVIRAAQTLQQLAEDEGGRVSALEGGTITDWPAFKVRGFMHDVGRSYISIEELEKEIRLYSRFKINVFQWHLTENQAWRFEVRKHPELTDAAHMTRYAGRYYTQDQCRALDALAYKYGVYILPELDMPGHSAAFTRSTGHDMQSEEGMSILRDALDDCMATFVHAPYIHIGGDEVAITYDNFLNIMTDYIHEHGGKRVVWWNNCAGVGTTRKKVSAATDHCDMAQCWASSGTKVSGVPCIDCRYNYTNHFDIFADLVGIYRSNILGRQHGDAETAGFISCPWNDRKLHSQDDIISQNNVYAVTIASGERAWKGGGRQYIEQGGAVLPGEGEEYEEFRSWEERFLFHKAHSLAGEPIPYVRQTNVRWRISSPVPNGGDGGRVFAQWEDCKALEVNMPDSVVLDGKTYGWTPATGAGIYLSHTWGSIVPGIWGRGIPVNQTAYAYTYVYSATERDAHALIEFQNYGRSENDPAPARGQWDRKGSDIWLNGQRINPPAWLNDGGGGGNSEAELRDENFSSTERRPVPVHLQAGWNKVFLKLPYVPSGCRLNKWLFTFVLTDATGRSALEDVIYSPSK